MMKAKQHESNAEMQLLSFVCHELRSPVQTIVATVDLLALMDLPSEAQSAIQKLDKSAGQLARMLGSVARFYRASVGALAERLEPVRLRELVQSVVDEVHDAGPVDIVIEAEVAPDLSATIDIDVDRVRHILSNYVLNAVRHGSGSVVRVAAYRHQDVIRIDVTNAGRFKGPQSSPSDWRAFERGDSATRDERGMGLGLVVVKLLAGQAGWEIGMLETSSPDETTFFVQLPFQPAGEQA